MSWNHHGYNRGDLSQKVRHSPWPHDVLCVQSMKVLQRFTMSSLSMQGASTGKGHAANGRDGSARRGSGLGARALRPLRGLLWALKPLLKGGLRRTTLLLLLIWFTNALCYYGLVLLTTSVGST